MEVRHLKVEANVGVWGTDGGCAEEGLARTDWREKTVSAGSLAREPVGSVRARRKPRRHQGSSVEAKCTTRHQDRHIWAWGSDVRWHLNPIRG